MVSDTRDADARVEPEIEDEVAATRCSRKSLSFFLSRKNVNKPICFAPIWPPKAAGKCVVFSSGNRQNFEILTLLITQMRSFLSEIPVIHQLYNQLHVAKVKSVITHEKLRKTHHVFF